MKRNGIDDCTRARFCSTFLYNVVVVIVPISNIVVGAISEDGESAEARRIVATRRMYEHWACRLRPLHRPTSEACTKWLGMQGIFPDGWWRDALCDVPKRTGEVSLRADALLGRGEDDGEATVAHIICQMRAAQACEAMPTAGRLGDWLEEDTMVPASGAGGGVDAEEGEATDTETRDALLAQLSAMVENESS